MSFFGRSEPTQIMPYPVCADFGLEPIAISMGTLKARLRTAPFGISAILVVAGFAQIAPSVISAIAIGVVNLVLRIAAGHHLPNHTMHLKSLRRRLDVDVALWVKASGWFPGESRVAVSTRTQTRKMISGTNAPTENAGFRRVVEAFQQVFQRGQGVFNFPSLGRFAVPRKHSRHDRSPANRADIEFFGRDPENSASAYGYPKIYTKTLANFMPCRSGLSHRQQSSIHGIGPNDRPHVNKEPSVAN